MNATRATLSSFAVLALAGCATVQARTDYAPDVSFTQFSTYDWVERESDAGGDPAVNSPLLARHIQDAVEGELGRMGYRKVTSDTPDFRIAYRVIAYEQSSVDGSYGYGGPYGYPGYSYRRGFFGYRYYGRRYYTPYYGYRSLGHAGTGYVNDYLRGTLVLDIIDVRTDEVVFRGWARKSLDSDPRPEKVRMYVNEAVEKILEDFPPERSASGRHVIAS